MIALSALSKAYGTAGSSLLVVLKAISLNIKQGEFVAIMGPSGSGKSTLLNIIGCLDTFDHGTYQFNDKSIDGLTSDELANLRLNHIGFVFQSFNLIPQLSAQANVELPLQYSNVSKQQRQKQAIAQLQLLGLGERLTHKPSELSGGQQQRVAIARAMINNPDLLIADEPTGSLDTETGIEIMELFQQLNKQGKTIVMVTHEDEVASYASRVVRMRDGKITDRGLKQ
jgi:putative ABC transport system ATP-binding protein